MPSTHSRSWKHDDDTIQSTLTLFIDVGHLGHGVRERENTRCQRHIILIEILKIKFIRISLAQLFSLNPSKNYDFLRRPWRTLSTQGRISTSFKLNECGNFTQ